MDLIITQALEPLQPLFSAQQRSGATAEASSSSTDEDAVTISFSPEALEAAGALPPVESIEETDGLTNEADADDPEALEEAALEAALEEALREAITEGAAEPASSATDELSDAEKQMVAKLEARDREVRAHEQAHMSAGGGLAGAASYTYQTGPDGKRYAIGGEVPISVPSTSNPQQALVNAQRMRAAALAPASPSGQDRAVAARAANMIANAQAMIAEDQQAQLKENLGSGEDADTQRARGLDGAGRERVGADKSEPETSGYDERIRPANMGGAFWRNWANR